MILLSAAQLARRGTVLTHAQLDGVNYHDGTKRKSERKNTSPTKLPEKRTTTQPSVPISTTNLQNIANGKDESLRNTTTTTKSILTKTKNQRGSEAELSSQKLSHRRIGSSGSYTSTSSSSSSTIAPYHQSRRKAFPPKKVSFGYIHVREHAVTVGDHDCCDGTLPVTLDWRHAETKSIGIDDFEWIRERQGVPRTPRGRLIKLDTHKRKYLLQHVSGISAETLASMCQSRQEEKQKQEASLKSSSSANNKNKRPSRTVTNYPRPR